MRSVTVALVAHAALLGLLTGAGCPAAPGGEEEATLPRPARGAGRAPDADLLALVPDGAHLVATVDLEQLRRVARGRAWATGAAEAGAPLAARVKGILGRDLLEQAAVLVLALWLDEAGTGQILLLARGGPEGAPTRAPGAAPPARKAAAPLGALVRRRLQGRGKAVQWGRYRGVELASFGEEATALPTLRTVVSGPGPLVKHALDLLGEVPGFSSVREDRELMALWRLVAGPTEGRAPAFALVGRFPDSMRGRLSKRFGLKSPPLRAGVRMSAAEWITVRAFVDCPDQVSAQAVIEGLQQAVAKAAKHELVRHLGLAPLLGRLAVHQEGARVHAQWLAPMKTLDPYLTRLLGLLRLELPADRPHAFPKPRDP